MTWLDVTLVVFIGLVTFGGVRRGLILEFFDWVLIAIASIVALAGYRPLANVLSFLGWEQGALRGTTFFLIFVSMAAVIIVVALILDRNYKHTLPKAVNEWIGGFLGAIKGVLLAWLLVLTLWHLPFDDSFRERMKRAPVVQWVQKTVAPNVSTFVETFSNKEVARDLRAALKKSQF